MTAAAINAKHWVLRHYLWVAVTLLLSALAASLCLPLTSWHEWAAIIGIPFGFLIATQKQKTEELELFTELFTKFNRRYDRLNEELNAIYGTPEEKAIDDEERNTLFDYFNLCGEEFLFYCHGYIYPEVWTAWSNGMRFFRRNRRIRELWDDELKTDSYYGLQFPRKHEQRDKQVNAKSGSEPASDDSDNSDPG